MRRREVLIGGAASLWSIGTAAQQVGRIPRIGVFVSTNPIMGAAYNAFLDELGKQGFVEGQGVVVEHRPSDQPPAVLARNVAEMMSAGLDVIVTASQPALQAAVATGQPVVLVANNFDPIAHGYVRSLAKPGGNVTGVVLRQTELSEKQVELMTQAFPDRKRLAMQWDNISVDQFAAAEHRAKVLGLDVMSLKLDNPPYDFPAAFRRMAEGGAQMVLTLSTPFFGPQTEIIVGQAIQHRLPGMFIFRRWAELGGLMSYGADNVTMYRQAAVYVAKILRGAKPADLPVEQPNKFELVINLKTAKTIGVELPTSILLRADEVIE